MTGNKIIPDFLYGILINVVIMIVSVVISVIIVQSFDIWDDNLFLFLLLFLIAADIGVTVYMFFRNKIICYGMLAAWGIPLMLYGACEGMMI